MAQTGAAAFEATVRSIPGLVSGADYTGSLNGGTGADAQFRFVKISGDFTVVLAGDDEMPIGVLMNKPYTGHAAEVAGVGSVVKIKTGGAITAGNKLTPIAAGTGLAVATSEADDPVTAVALAGADSGDYVTALIVGGFTLAAS